MLKYEIIQKQTYTFSIVLYQLKLISLSGDFVKI